MLNGIPIDEEDFFGRQLAFNSCRYCRIAKVACVKNVVSLTSTQNPAGRRADDFGKRRPGTVFYGHAQMVNFEALRPLAAEKRVMRLLRAKILCSLKRTNPDSGGGCFWYAASFRWLRTYDYGMPEQVQFWSVADNVRFAAR